MVCVSILIHGDKNYFLAGREAILSVLENSDFSIHVLIGKGPSLRLPRSRRIQVSHINDLPPHHHRSERFLLKFNALKMCAEGHAFDFIIMLDADALFTGRIEAQQLEEALGDHELGMVEQTIIKGSPMVKKNFYHHYITYSLARIAPSEIPPALEHFRYYNSGVVIGRGITMEKMASWALAHIAEISASGLIHQIGEHMIADQDYIQYWTNNLYPSTCVALPWFWNHGDHWDKGFSQSEALIVHFSNFCMGPDTHVLMQLYARRGKKRLPFVVRTTSLVNHLKRLLFVATGKRWI